MNNAVYRFVVLKVMVALVAGVMMLACSGGDDGDDDVEEEVAADVLAAEAEAKDVGEGDVGLEVLIEEVSAGEDIKQESDDEETVAEEMIAEEMIEEVVKECKPTESDAKGPYFVEGVPFKSNVVEADEPGTKLLLSGTLYGADCVTPVAHAIVNLWQTDAEGKYAGPDDGFRLRGKVKSGDDGSYAFSTVFPGHYEGRPVHIHYKVDADGFLELVTQLYFAGDEYLWPNDSCGKPTCNSDDPDRIITVTEEVVDGETVLVGTFDIYLTAE